MQKDFPMRCGYNGHSWYVLIGPNIHEGEVGFGATLIEALQNLTIALNKQNYRALLARITELGSENAGSSSRPDSSV